MKRDCHPGEPQRCNDCDRLCRSSDCFAAHKALSGNQQNSLCDQVYQCRKCCKVIRKRDCARDFHRCGTSKCPSCQQFVVTAEHQCYLRRVSSKTPCDKLIFFDFETDQSSGTHEVNFAVAQYIDGREEIFKGYAACEHFCSWLFTPRHKGFTAIAHNMKGFDGQFILEWMLKQGTTPEVIPCGGKLMSIHLKSKDITIIDSLNFLPMPLSRLPSSFGLCELKKGFFPHLFNTRENQSYIGPLPEVHYFSPDSMATATRRDFFLWHDEHKRDVFDFQEEILSYCRSDVDILRRSCIEFRAQFLEVANVDPFRYVTIASVCMATYRSKDIQPNTIAMVPVHGYVNRTNFSPDSIRWLDYVASTQGVHIQHALNGKGEWKINGISVDGFCEETNTIYQYQGCFFHGCGTCYDADVIHPLKHVSMGTLRQQTEENILNLRARGHEVIEMWEHTFKKMKQHSLELKSFLLTHNLKDRLNPRDAFFGGRTNALKLYSEGDIRYIDFTSLYPWVNKYCMYPVGHPTIITKDFGDVDDYFGILHCKVIPPRGLFLPVLPYRCQKKLMFPLCHTCAENMQQSTCTHTDEERALVGTWVSEELKLAKKKGYRVTEIYEVYHFEKKSDKLFKSFIDRFLKIKQESSGWPAECVSEEEKANYVLKYEEREGVKLDPASIINNPGRRQVAKLSLNSFWGRWGMNINKDRMTFVNNVSNFNKMMIDPTKNIKDVFLPTPEVAAIHWKNDEDFVAQDTATNIFIAAFTTAWARLKLYSEMDKLRRSVLYHDTDSIVYVSDGMNDPPLGNFLGEFTDELEGDIISTFVSGGPKNYGYETRSGDTCCKVRGFTLNFRNSQTLNFESIKN